MVKVLEPILFDGVTHLVVVSNTQENEEINLGFAHDEGALILAAAAFWDDGDRATFVDTNALLTAMLRTTDSLASNVAQGFISQNTLWYSSVHIQGVLDTAVGGEFFHYLEGQWGALPGGGVIISRNPFAEFRMTATGQSPSLKIAYKRVLFEEGDLVQFVAQRR